jgi:pimeloyl-ACP methyl ester carboxylesterase
VEPGCTTNGCIHAFAQVNAFSQKVLSNAADPSNAVANGVVQYAITYVSDGAEITGTVFYPDSTPPAAGFPVAVMNQFTSGLGTPCAPSGGDLAIGVASTTAINGIVTLVPDATSYGTLPHGAYMDEKISGRAALDGVRAAFHTSQAAGKPIVRRAVVAGLSQGAYSTMAAATEFPTYANQLEVRAFVAAEPPSNFRPGCNRSLSSDASLVVYEAMRMWSWQGLHSLSGGAMFLPPYDTEIPQWFATACIFNNDGSDGALYGDFFVAGADGGPSTTPIPASQIFTSNFIGYAKTDSWPTDWATAYTNSQTVPAYLTVPVTIFEGSADVTVIPSDVDAYVAQLKAAGVNVNYVTVPGGTHGTTALSSFTVAQAANGQAISIIQAALAN